MKKLLSLFCFVLLACGASQVLPTVAPTANFKTPTAVLPATNTPSPKPEPIILEFEGRDNDLKSFTLTGSENAAVTFISGQFNDDAGNFIVFLKDASGELVHVVANCIDNCEDRTITSLPPGKYYLEVTAGGAWTVLVVLP